VSGDLLLDPALKAGLGPAALRMAAVKPIIDRRKLGQAVRPSPGKAARARRLTTATPQPPGVASAAGGSSQGTVSTTASGSTGL
jgi:hypothetical protein